jgi:hypothetical protein
LLPSLAGPAVPNACDEKRRIISQPELLFISGRRYESAVLIGYCLDKKLSHILKATVTDQGG